MIPSKNMEGRHPSHMTTALVLLAFFVLAATPLAPVAHAQTVIATVPVGAGPLSLAYDPAKGEIFVANSGNNTVSVISDTTNTVVANVSLAFGRSSCTGGICHGVGGPVGLAYDSAKGEVFVVFTHNNTVSVISDTTNTVFANISLYSSAPPLYYGGIAYDSTKGEVFVANYGNNSVDVISDSTNSVVATVGVPGPYGIAYDSAKGEIFVSEFNVGPPNEVPNIAVISDTTNAIIATVPLGSNTCGGDCAASSLAYDSKGEVFAAIPDNLTVAIISDTTNSVVATVPIGSEPDFVAYGSSYGEVFVSSVNRIVSFISDSTNTIVGSVLVGDDPAGMTYDPIKGEIFVANGPDTVSVISDGTISTTSSTTSTSSTVPEFSYTALLAVLTAGLTAVAFFARKPNKPRSV